MANVSWGSGGPNFRNYVAEEDGKIIIGEVADVAGNLDRVQRMRQADIKSQTFGYVKCSVPMLELGKWCNQFGIDIAEAVADDRILDRFLRDHGKFVVHKGWQ